MRKFGLFFLITVLSLSICSNVFACTMSKQYEEWLNLSDEEKKNTPTPTYCQELYMDPTETKSINEINKRVFKDSNYLKVMAGATDSSYINPYLTPVKNQMSTGICWIFSSIGMLEHLALKDNYGLLDFSERHVIHMLSNKLFTDYTYPSTFSYEEPYKLNVDYLSGGTIQMASNYFYRMDGPVYESEMPFQNSVNPAPSAPFVNLKGHFLLDNYYEGQYDRNSCTDAQLRKFKELIYQYGSVGVTIKMATDSTSLKDGMYLNYTGYALVDHAVVLVGWDDNISKDKFNNATRNGAFIAKNSYSARSGDNGYYYISYDDVWVCSDYNVFDGISPNLYTKSYQTATAFTNGYGTSSQTDTSSGKQALSIASKITVTGGSQYLSRISFQAPANATYNIFLSKNGYTSNSSTWKHLAYGSTTEAGVYTAKFPDYEIDGTFHIIIDFQSQNTFGYKFYCSVKNTEERWYTGETPRAGMNYLYAGGAWYDMATIRDQNDSMYGCAANVTIYTSPNKVFGSNEYELGDPSGVLKVGDTSSQITIPYTLSANFNTEFVPTINFHLEGSTTLITDKFSYTLDKTNKKIIISLLDENIESGDYVIDVEFDGTTKSQSFRVIEDLNIDISFSTYTLKDDLIIIPIPKNLKVLYTDFTSDMTLGEGLTYNITDKNGTIISELDGNGEVSRIKTNYRLVVGNATFIIVVQGDPTEDGNIGATDYIRIKNHIMEVQGKIITDRIIKIAADANNNGDIGATDYVRIKNYIMAANS